MKAHGFAALVIVGTLAVLRPVAAQDVRGFVGGGSGGDGYSNNYPTFGGGVLVDLGRPWVSAGGQGDGFVAWPYFAGRGAVFAQGNLISKGVIRPFVLAGRGWGVLAGPMYGAGVEVRPIGSRMGFRASVENYVRRSNGPFGVPAANQISVRLAVLFR